MRALAFKTLLAASSLLVSAALAVIGAYWLEVSTVSHRRWCEEQRCWIDDRTGETSPIDASYFAMRGRREES